MGVPSAGVGRGGPGDCAHGGWRAAAGRNACRLSLPLIPLALFSFLLCLPPTSTFCAPPPPPPSPRAGAKR